MRYWIHSPKDAAIQTPVPSTGTAGPDPAALAQWRQASQAAMGRMSDLAQALDRRDWPGMARICRWVREELPPRNAREEQEFFPLLARTGARTLGKQLARDHRHMDDLARAILEQEGDPQALAAQARRMLDLVRQHIDMETHQALPLLQGLTPMAQAGATDAGYRGLPVPSYGACADRSLQPRA